MYIYCVVVVMILAIAIAFATAASELWQYCTASDGGAAAPISGAWSFHRAGAGQHCVGFCDGGPRIGEGGVPNKVQHVTCREKVMRFFLC